jgi:RimJ/RimL family protein N-acetyltransferase
MKPAEDPKTTVGLVLPFTFTLKDSRECLIRGMVEDDAEELCEFLPKTHIESDFLNYLPGEFDKTVEQEREFIREHNAKPCSISMTAVAEGRIVAVAGGASPEQRRYVHHAECGLVVLKEFWGAGLGRELMECLVEWARQAGLRKLNLKVFADNTRAIRLYESLGFVEEGRLKGDVLRGDGTYGDTLIMAHFFVGES